MSRNKIMVLAVLGLAGATSNVQAGILFSDDFSYADGALVPNGEWTDSVFATGTVISGEVYLSDRALPYDGFDQDHGMNESTASTFYFGIKMRVDSLADVPGNQIGLEAGISLDFTGGTSDWAPRFRARSNGSSIDLIATAGNAAGADANEQVVGTFSPGETIQAVLRFTYNSSGDEQIAAALNPTSEGDLITLNASNLENAGNNGFVDDFALMRANGDSSVKGYVDDYILATEFTDIVVPEPASLAMLGVAGLMLVRRR